MTTVQNNEAALDPDDVAALSAAITGPVLVPGDADYAEETATFNLILSHRPAVVVGATSPEDVRAAILFATAQKLPIAVLATGHGAVVSADDAVLINTRRMTGVSIDADRRTARVEAGVRWQQVVDDAAEFGLAPIAGSSPEVGVVAYHLGGGLSPVLSRTLGYAADHVRTIDIVTADGQARQVSAEQEPELFWALRGGKGNFGVVTALEFDLFPVTSIYGGGLYFDGADAATVLRTYRSWVAEAPEDLSSSILLLRTPDLPVVPEPLRGRLVVHVRISYLGSVADGERLVAPLRAAAPVVIDYVAEMPFSAIATIHADPTEPIPAYERTTLLRELPEALVDRVLDLAGPQAQTPIAAVEIRQLGGALSRQPVVPNAVDNRDAQFIVLAVAIAGPDQAGEIKAALGELIDRLEPWSTGGTYPNFMSAADTAPEQVRAAYRPETYERLVLAKKTYDPQNLFRINHNLNPS